MENLKNGTKINIYEFNHQAGEYIFKNCNLVEMEYKTNIEDDFTLGIFTDKNYKFEILSEEEKDEEIDIDEVLKIEKDHMGQEYVFYKNKGETESGYSRSYSYSDVLMVKAIKQLYKKIK